MAWFQNALRSVALVMLLFIALVVLSRMQVRRQTREIRQSSEALAAEKERLEVTLAYR